MFYLKGYNLTDSIYRQARANSTSTRLQSHRFFVGESYLELLYSLGVLQDSPLAGSIRFKIEAAILKVANDNGNNSSQFLCN